LAAGPFAEPAKGQAALLTAMTEDRVFDIWIAAALIIGGIVLLVVVLR
jgi:hypothetical protein